MKINFKFVYRIVFSLIGWFGIVGHIVQKVLSHPEWSVGFSILDSLSHYTIQTNILVLVWFTIALIYWKREDENLLLRPKIKGAFTLYISATFIIYAILLAKLWAPEGLDLYLSIISHYVTPIAFMIDWLLYEKKQVYRWIYAIQWLIYPLSYLVYNQIYGKLTGRYLYPFLNLPVIGMEGLIIRVVILCGFFIVVGSIYIFLNKIREQKVI